MHRYRKISAHNDYSWDSPPSKELSQKATMFLQSHTEVRAHKTLIWFRHKQEGYLLFCYEEEGRFDSTGRVCEALILVPLAEPLGFTESMKFLETSWDAESEFSIPETSNTTQALPPHNEMLHILLCENIYYTNHPSTFEFACQHPADDFILFMSTKEIPFHEEIFGLGFVAQSQPTRIEKAAAFIAEYAYPLDQITPSRFQSILPFSHSVREFLIGILANYWKPEEHLDMLSTAIYDWFWEHWNPHYIENSTSDMAQYAIQNKDVQDEQIRAFLSQIHSSDADFLLPWFKEQEDGFDLAQQHFPERTDIHNQIFPPNLQELWNNLQQGILPEQYHHDETREAALTQLVRFRSLRSLPPQILEALYVHSGILTEAYKDVLKTQGIDVDFLDDVFSGQAIQSLPPHPPSFRLPNLSIIIRFIFSIDPPNTKEWLLWWEKQQPLNIRDQSLSYDADYWEWSVRMLSEENLLIRTILWREELSEKQKQSAVQNLNTCSSSLIEQILSLPHNTGHLSFQEAHLWTQILQHQDFDNIRTIIIQQGLRTKESRYFEVLSFTRECIQILEGNPPPYNDSISWPSYMVPILTQHLSQQEYWNNWGAEDLQNHSSWLSMFQELPISSFLTTENIPPDSIIQYPHLLSTKQTTDLLSLWAKDYSAPQRHQIIDILLSKVPRELYTWLYENICTPFFTGFPMNISTASAIPYVHILTATQALQFLLYELSSSRNDSEKEELMHAIIPILQQKNIDPLPAPPTGSMPDICCTYIATSLQWSHWDPNSGAS